MEVKFLIGGPVILTTTSTDLNMKIYKQENKIVKIVQSVLCDCCGKPATIQNNDGCDIEWTCNLKMSSQVYGPFPGQHYDAVHLDFCPACYKNKILPLTILVPNSYHRDADSGVVVDNL